MNKNAGCAVISAFIGSAIGALVTHYIEKKKKETVYFDLSKKKDETKVDDNKDKEKTEENAKETVKPEVMADIPSYDDNSGNEKPESEKKSRFPVKYRDLSSEEFLNDENGYDKETLTLYSDGLLIDETYHKVSAKDTIGVERMKKYVSRFKETGGDGSFYVRNNSIETDYEIVYDSRKAGDVIDFDLGDE